MITVDQVAALARDASMSSSYKPALLKALVRIVRGGATSPVSLLHIGHEFVDLYWVQTVDFDYDRRRPLPQNRKSCGASVVHRI